MITLHACTVAIPSLCLGLAAVLGVAMLPCAPGAAVGQPARSHDTRIGGEVTIEAPEVGLAGKLPVSGFAEHVRTVRNHAKSRVSLRSVQSSCPCITLRIDPVELAPGDAATVSIRAPVLPQTGSQSHWAMIEVREIGPDTPRAERFRVAVAYEADLSFVVEPPRLWCAGVVGEPLDRRVYVRSNALDALDVRDIRVEPSILAARVTRRISLDSPAEPGLEALEITLSGEVTTTGRHAFDLVFSTNDEKFPQVRVPAELLIRPSWTAIPAGFAFLIDHADRSTRTLSIRVRGRRGGRLAIAELELRHGSRPIRVEGVTITQATDSDGATTISATADFSVLTRSAGVLDVALLDHMRNELGRIPFVWIRRRAAVETE